MTNQTGIDRLPPLSLEFEGADFGDFRLTRRLQSAVDAAEVRPGAGFPTQAASSAELEGTYRFLGNEKVTPDKILEPHVACTVARCAEREAVLVVHDTTEFAFDPETTRDLGYLNRNQRGFLGHFSLAVSADGSRNVLGILSLITVFRPKPQGSYSNQQEKKAAKRKEARGSEMAEEFKRWWNGARAATEALAGKVAHVVHVMDREGDSYALLAHLLEEGMRFVIRLSQDRVATDQESGQTERILSKLERQGGTAEREVQLSRRTAAGRTPKSLQEHPPRQARLARLNFSATRATITRPHGRPGSLPEFVTVNFVRVWEPEPPEGEAPIEWRLMTTESIDTPEQVLAVVDAYRARWLVEEFFRALKTGTAYEKRQVESRRGMLNALAMLAPVAWRLLNLRNLGRQDPDAPATEVLTETQIDVLRAIVKRQKKHSLPRRPTVAQAMLAIALLGGYVKSRRPPGWIVLGRGLHDLLIAEMAWVACVEARKA